MEVAALMPNWVGKKALEMGPLLTHIGTKKTSTGCREFPLLTDSLGLTDGHKAAPGFVQASDLSFGTGK